MELVKKNIHMDRTRFSTSTQLSMEEDINLPENKPDCNTICLSKGWVETEDVKPHADEIHVTGYLHYCILYHTDESGCCLVKLEGKLPFEETIHLQGVTAADLVQVEGDTEDLSIGMINSRKLSIRSVINLLAKAEELYDEEVTIGLHSKEPVEYRRTPMDIAQLMIHKKDIFRIREEFPLPANYPNIFRILWSDLMLKDVEFKPQNGRLALQGEIKAFLMYEAEGEAHDILYFERSIPFSGAVECQGCKDMQTADISYCIAQKEFTIRPDEDGEERNIGLEMVLEMKMNLYEEEPVEAITDIYGVACEVKSQTRRAMLHRMMGKVNGKMKLTEKIRVRARSGGILQIVHCEGKVSVEEQKNIAEGVNVSGILHVKVLFITGEDSMPYASEEEQIPYSYTLEIPGIDKNDICNVHAQVEQMQLSLLDGEEMELKAILSFRTTAMRPIPIELVENIETEKLNAETWGSIPGMVIYIVKPGDSLWSIGKQYYTPVEQIKKLNYLDRDQLQVGQKLFLVKGNA